jgi:hypothetical protein
MILVAGLAIAGLAGIAAAFYFSMRPGGSRVRAAARSARSDGSDRPARFDRPAGAGASAGSRSGRAGDRAGASTVIDFTGPQPVLDDSEPVVADRRARHGDRADDTLVTPGPGRRVAAARSASDADADDAAKMARSRRRVGWRKGSDVDEELWPAESFGGVSDEQFWDDMAADKPLATTARAAQPETATRRRPPNAGPLPDLYPADGRSREDGRRTTTEGAGTHPQPRLSPDDRTAIQPALQLSGTAPLTTQQPPPGATQPVRAMPPVPAPPAQPHAAPPAQPHAAPPAQPRAGARGRSRAAISPDEDPLTSPAYSLRAPGSVDGRSRQPRDPGREQYANGRGRYDGYRPDPLRSDPLRSDYLRPDPLRSGDGYSGTATYPYPQQPYGEPASSASTPPYGERYGTPNPAGQSYPGGQSQPAGDPRRANGGWSPGQANGNGEGAWGTGSRPGYPPVNGRRDPYDPRGYDRRLTTLH